MIDLHTHSRASDGSLEPAALVEEAARRGLRALALTDHDTTAGLAEAAGAAARLGLGFIPGIELEIERGEAAGGGGAGADGGSGKAGGGGAGSGAGGAGGAFHLLGLGIWRPGPLFDEAVAWLAERRERRNREIIERMRELLGIDVTYEDARALSGGHSVGRPHFAALLVRRGITRGVEAAFERFLSPGRPLYAPRAGLGFDRAVAAIKEAGGIAVLAHPLSLYVSWGRLPGLLAGLRDRGLDGVEARHPGATAAQGGRLEALARDLGLMVTEGSDFHGETRPERRLGMSGRGRKIDEARLDARVRAALRLDALDGPPPNTP